MVKRKYDAISRAGVPDGGLAIEGGGGVSESAQSARRVKARVSTTATTMTATTMTTTTTTPSMVSMTLMASAIPAEASLAEEKDTAAPSSPAATTFPRFMELPAELRFSIWRIYREESMPPLHPFRVRLYMGRTRVQRRDKKSGYVKTVKLTPLPELGLVTRTQRDMLRICREARAEFTRTHFRDVLEFSNGGLLRFDALSSIVYLDILNDECIAELASIPDPARRPAFTRVVRHIGFEMVPRLPYWTQASEAWLDPRLEFILCFPRLRSLSLVSFADFTEVDWQDAEEVAFFRNRAEAHGVHFRGFRALDTGGRGGKYGGKEANGGYSRHCAIGNVCGPTARKHDCVICTVHKCCYVRDFLRDSEDVAGQRPDLTPEQNRWLAGLDYHTLLPLSGHMLGKIEEISL